jgi:hypothetical protein
LAGPNHHHVWRHLQNGFGTIDPRDSSGRDWKVWVYARGGAPKTIVTRKHGAEKFFYGPEGSAADRNLTELENRAQGLIHEARRAESGTPIRSDLMAPIIASLEMRAAGMRRALSLAADGMFDELTRTVGSSRFVERVFRRLLATPSEWMDEQIMQAGVSQSQLALAYAALEHAAADVRDAARSTAETTHTLVSEFRNRLPEIVAQAHIRALEANFGEIERASLHKGMDYVVIRLSCPTLILPDSCLAIGHHRGVSPTSNSKCKVHWVLLPISPTVMIAGGSGFPLQQKALRRVLASVSYDSFVADQDTPEYRRLASRIGRNAALLSAREIAGFLTEDALIADLTVG